MNMTTPELTRARIDALPEPELPEHLWHRVELGYAQRIRRRWAGAGAGVAMLLLVVLAPSLRPPDSPPAVTGTPVAQATDTQPATAIHDRLRAMDIELQRAYDRGASDGEIELLLATRRALSKSVDSRQLRI